MSQLPSLLESGARPLRRRRNHGLPVGQLGLRATGNAPGLAVLPANTEGQRLFNDLSRSLGLIGNVANQFTAQQQRETARREKEDIEAERIDRGEATVATDELLPQLLWDIAEGQFVRPDELDAGQFANQIIGSNLPENVSKSFKTEFHKRMIGPVTAGLVGFEAAGIKDAKIAAVKRLQDGASGLTNVQELHRFVKDARVLGGLSQYEAIVAIGRNVAAVAAQRGDKESFNAAVKLLDGRDSVNTARLAGVLSAAIRAGNKENQQQATDEINALNVQLRDPSSGVTHDTIRKRIREIVQKRRLPSTFLEGALLDQDRRQAGELSALHRQLIGQRVLQFRREHTSELVNLLSDPTNGFNAGMVRDIEFEVLGKTLKFTRAEQLDAAYEIIKARITEQQYPGDTQAQQQAQEDAVLQYLFDSGHTDKDIEAQLNSAFIGIGAGATTDNLTDSPVLAFRMFKRMRALRSGMVGRHTTDDTLAKFRIAAFIERNLPQVGEKQAIILAANTDNPEALKEGPRNIGISAKATETAITALEDGFAKDPQALATVLDIARALQLVGRVGDVPAVDEALRIFKEDFVSINGFAVNIRGLNVPAEAIRRVGDILIDFYLNDNEDRNQLYDRDNLTIFYNSVTDEVYLANLSNGTPIEDSPVINGSELSVIAQKDTEAGSLLARKQASWRSRRNAIRSNELARFIKRIGGGFLLGQVAQSIKLIRLPSLLLGLDDDGLERTVPDTLSGQVDVSDVDKNILPIVKFLVDRQTLESTKMQKKREEDEAFNELGDLIRKSREGGILAGELP